jgi:hypothetical protein
VERLKGVRVYTILESLGFDSLSVAQHALRVLDFEYWLGSEPDRQPEPQIS